MRLTEILNEQQINELSWKDVAKTAARSFRTGYNQGIGGTIKNKIVDKLTGDPAEPTTPANTTSGQPTSAPPRSSGITYKQLRPGGGLDYEEIKQAALDLSQQEKDALVKDLSTNRLQPAATQSGPVTTPKTNNLDIPTAQRQGKTIPQDAPASKPQGTVADVGKKQSQPGQRQKGDIVKAGDNTLQWTGEPGKEWFVAGGTLSKPNPQTDKMNKIQQDGGKRYISAADAKQLLQTENRIHSRFLGIDL